MDGPSRTLFALFLAALWCGFALYGLARLAARSPQRTKSTSTPALVRQ